MTPPSQRLVLETGELSENVVAWLENSMTPTLPLVKGKGSDRCRFRPPHDGIGRDRLPEILHRDDPLIGTKFPIISHTIRPNRPTPPWSWSSRISRAQKLNSHSSTENCRKPNWAISSSAQPGLVTSVLVHRTRISDTPRWSLQRSPLPLPLPTCLLDADHV